ncbi:HpcH/HpaI aldolase/citrate lyase family protein [Beggiatoa leptomitoformis]|uniref:CoA ester lyase n=1 Tax=Beggiatoa leptomitoformis TaxID=288004 RepID=A0A2N9YGG0_9GAMM|nr:CoA ester lyase [Beggiatoa leptomitoformis]ALG68119.1 CoA ester lyase [Beggiatoa leptomitoformis]AUI69584.1 CoA ester lyase [Beggiatoa leptomitoformis]
MHFPLRPRRSMLYMPGANARALEKARMLPADSLILDMEDAVAPDAKAQAREQIVTAVNEGGYGKREIIVRVNGLDTAWGKDDLYAIAKLPIDGILLPKIDNLQQINDSIDQLNAAGASEQLPIWIMAETAACMLNIASIATHPRLAGIVMGTSDLAKEIRAKHTADRIGMLVPLSLCVLAARANGLEILDGVYLNLDDEAGFCVACEQGRNMGFDGKTLIHPKQVDIANQIFSPSGAEINHAQEVIHAWEEARQASKGVVVVNGKLVENLHYEESQRILALAGAIKERHGQTI